MTESTAQRDAVAKLMERYDQHAGAYRELWAPILRMAALPLVRKLASASVRRVLDVGTGVGCLLPDLQASFPRAAVLGVDRSAGMLALAPREFGRAQMDAANLALRPGSFDGAFMLFMLFHLESPEAGLAEARRVLRPGSFVATLTWGGDLESKATLVWEECLDRHGAIPRDAAAEARHENVDSPTKMDALLRRSGYGEANSWADDLVCTIEAEHLLRLKTQLGSSKPRFDSLPPAAASACLEDARRRMGDLSPEDFVARGAVVYAVARSR